MTGLAHDRGLFVPDSFPTVTAEELESWRSLSYAELATEVIGKYVKEDEVPKDVLADIVGRSCGAFRSKEVTPLVKVDDHYVLVSILLCVTLIAYFNRVFPSSSFYLPGTVPRTDFRL